MKRILFFISLFIVSAFGQPKEQIEFQLNTISGVVLNSIDATPVIQLKVEVLSGNNLTKDSTLTDENGYFIMEQVGYVWKPKIRFSIKNYQTKTLNLKPDDLDTLNNMVIGQIVTPVPDEQMIPELSQSTAKTRANIFFIKGNVFYNLKNSSNAERVIIQSSEAIESRPGFIIMNINGKMYDPARCYVPQEGRYENLSYILRSLLREPIFEHSGHPKYLPEKLLEPSVIYGTVINIKTGESVMGAELILSEPFKRRISDEHGRYAFQVDQPGTYQIHVEPPLGYRDSNFGTAQILVKYGRGGWFRSNQYVEP
ncbi:MAG: carboxypeptidase-like regulatory domain-containing protein [Candidatus Marinimicrobia bacterium]|nr:carboxypeptidase-like regulatory domain-containing protein [Candidatus Neomarinimicrobiota bacterium]